MGEQNHIAFSFQPFAERLSHLSFVFRDEYSHPSPVRPDSMVYHAP